MATENERVPLSAGVSQPSTSIGAVFLSYASEDAAAAERIATALRGAGIEVWFDKSVLRGGDAWDRQIRQHIHDCRLFIALISAHTEARDEGYFRREWRLAVERAGDMAEDKAFVVPVAIDGTSERSARVPDPFKHVQWTRLPGGETQPAFVERVRKLLAPGEPNTSPKTRPPADPLSIAVSATGNRTGALRRTAVFVMIGATVGLLLTYFAVDTVWLSKRTAAATASAAPPSTTAPEKSIAVLPFVDLSEKHDQEYFSDGLAEELIDLLAKTPGLKVIARTSSFSFKGKPDDIPTIAQKLKVAYLLEGSVRTSGTRLRATTQLIRADTDQHLWSETYDRELKDVFQIQDEIAGAVVKALKLSLLNEPGRRVTTANPEAYPLYLRGRTIFEKGTTAAETETGLRYLERSVQIDPDFAPAWATISRAHLHAFMDYGVGSFDVVRRKVLDAAQKAIAIDPSLAEAHLALARAMSDLDWQWGDAEEEMRRALELESRNATVLRNAFYVSSRRGRWQEAFERANAAVELDPLNWYNFLRLGDAEYYRQHYAEAEIHYRETLELAPTAPYVRSSLADVLLRQGKLSYVLSEAEKESDERIRRISLPYLLNALGRSSDAAKALADAESRYGSQFPYDIGLDHAALGNFDRAFYWWERALRQHDPAIVTLMSAPIDTRQPTLVKDARYRALLQTMNLLE